MILVLISLYAIIGILVAIFSATIYTYDNKITWNLPIFTSLLWSILFGVIWPAMLLMFIGYERKRKVDEQRRYKIEDND